MVKLSLQLDLEVLNMIKIKHAFGNIETKFYIYLNLKGLKGKYVEQGQNWRSRSMGLSGPHLDYNCGRPQTH